MGVLHELFDTVGGAQVRDVHVPGYLETEHGVPRFRSLPDTVYVDLGGRFLRIDTLPERGALTLTMVADMSMPPALEGEDDEFATASIGSLFFDVGGEPPITRIRYAVNSERDIARGVVRCAEIRLGAGVCLFFDPMSFDGIRVRTNGGYEAWQRDARERESEIFGLAKEFVWEPGS